MSQHVLFTQTLESAIEDLAAKVGEKKFASELRPDMAADDALRWFSHCLLTNRREKFSGPDLLHMVRIGRRIGCHVLADFINRDGGYERPVPRQLSTEISETSEEIARLHARAMERMEHLKRMESLLCPPQA